jgi:Fic family protein
LTTLSNSITERWIGAATRRLPITEAWLRALQAEVCGAQATYETLTDAGKQQQRLPHGEYKTSPNNVTQQDGTIHWYASVHDVPAEMHRLVTEMGSNAFQDAHAAVQAAFAHHALTAVHPFADGNGRTARALASVFLYRSAGVPPACREPHVRMQ